MPAPLVKIDQDGWKRIVEGITRGDIGPFEWQNHVEGTDCYRRYLQDGEVVAVMLVIDSNTEKLGCDCERVFEARQDLVDATAYIYVPTDADWEEFDELNEDPEFDARGWLQQKGIIA